jgi:anaerobic dimethyl sulfoxide reductase subunit B (iron-sulfur subunit)
MSKQYAFYFDSSACSGCKACQAACKDKHNLAVGSLWRRVYEVTGGGWQQVGDAWVPDVFAYNLSVACNHCQEPICAEVCPACAIIRREDGLVLLDSDKCLGCGYCSWVCPYGALHYDQAAGHITKCTFCVDEIDAGRSPACVAACPMRVLDFGDHSALDARYGVTKGSYPLPESHLTQPSLVINPHRDAHRSQSEPTQLVPDKQDDMKEWSLIIFTLLSQLAVGAFLVLSVLRSLLAQKAGMAVVELLSDTMLLVIEPVTIVSILISLLHLGTPRNAYRAFRNVRSSWLSREILFATLFASAGAVFTVMQWFKIDAFETRNIVAWVATLLGLALVYSMSRVYMLRTIPTWNSPATPLSFFTTSLMLGVLAISVALLNNYASVASPTGGLFRDETVDISHWMALSLVLLLGVQWAVIRLCSANLRLGQAATRSKPKIPKQYRTISGLHMALTFLGVGVMGTSLYQHILVPGQELPVTVLALLAFGLMLVSEGMGRFLFYKSHMRYGI